MIEAARGNGVELGILFIPSRVRVYHKWAFKGRVEVPDEIVRSFENEDILLRNYRRYFEDKGVRVVDATEYVLAALDRSVVAGKPLYAGGHPFAAGYQAYARAAMEILK